MIRQTDRQTDRQTGRQINRGTGRQTDDGSVAFRAADEGRK